MRTAEGVNPAAGVPPAVGVKIGGACRGGGLGVWADKMESEGV